MRSIISDIPITVGGKAHVVKVPFDQGACSLQLNSLQLTKASAKVDAAAPLARIVVTAHVRGLDDEDATEWQLAVFPVNAPGSASSASAKLDVRSTMEVVGVSAAWAGLPEGGKIPTRADASLVLSGTVSMTQV